MGWEVIKPNTGRVGRKKRACFAVRKARQGNACTLQVPYGSWQGIERVEVLFDGDKIAFRPTERGGYGVFPQFIRAKARRVTIPRRFKDFFPFGTTDVELTEQDGMYVLDLTAITADDAKPEGGA